MQQVPNLVPISEMRLHQSEVLDKLKAGPIILTQRSKAAAVLIDPVQWNRLIEHMENLQDILTIVRKEQRIAAGELAEVDVDIAELEGWRDGVPA